MKRAGWESSRARLSAATSSPWNSYRRLCSFFVWKLNCWLAVLFRIISLAPATWLPAHFSSLVRRKSSRYFPSICVQAKFTAYPLHSCSSEIYFPVADLSQEPAEGEATGGPDRLGRDRRRHHHSLLTISISLFLFFTRIISWLFSSLPACLPHCFLLLRPPSFIIRYIFQLKLQPAILPGGEAGEYSLLFKNKIFLQPFLEVSLFFFLFSSDSVIL